MLCALHFPRCEPDCGTLLLSWNLASCDGVPATTLELGGAESFPSAGLTLVSAAQVSSDFFQP